MTTNGKDPAYPVRGWTAGAGSRAIDPTLSEHDNEAMREAYHGLTKREAIAMAAMTALIPIWYDDDEVFDFPAVADDACKMADALLAELERTRKP